MNNVLIKSLFITLTLYFTLNFMNSESDKIQDKFKVEIEKISKIKILKWNKEKTAYNVELTEKLTNEEIDIFKKELLLMDWKKKSDYGFKDEAIFKLESDKMIFYVFESAFRLETGDCIVFLNVESKLCKLLKKVIKMVKMEEKGR